ncbi:MAG: replicative DNA helicase [Sulfurihydrogenibium sp.]|nr:replicative DNA helicase [Sulfurihydrogenibium sp.]
MNYNMLSQNNENLYDEYAERAVLGSLIAYPETQKSITASLTTDDFYLPQHRVIYETITNIINQGKTPSVYLVKNELEKQGKLESVGGIAYLMQILEESVPPDIALQIVDIITEKSEYRRLIETAQKIAGMVKSKVNPDEIKIKIVNDIKSSFKKTKAPEVLESLLKKGLKELNEYIKNPTPLGISSGFYDLDRMLNGFHSGELIVIGARPAMGKTAFALNVAYNIASQDKNVLFFSLEMNKKQIVPRIFSMISGVPLGYIINGMVDDEDAEKITTAFLKDVEILKRIFIDDSSVYLNDIVKTAYTTEKVDVIIIDYLQLIKTQGKYQMRYQELADISVTLRNLAKELDIPVITLAQVNREVEKKVNKRPTLADLRESGDIEATADVVMFLHREGYYKKDKNVDDSETEVIVAKNRNGENGVVKLSFDKKIQKFSEFNSNEADEEADEEIDI